MNQQADAYRQQSSQAYLRARQLDPHYAPHADHVLERKEQLGEGGMGTVYRVTDHRLGREAALKLMRARLRDPTSVRRFLREARITAQLDHPNIPPVYEFGTNVAGTHYMLMRVVEGKPLSGRIRDLHRGGAPRAMRTGAVAELLEVLVRVGEAVAYAHSHDVVHRDLKPANIMVGKFGEVMVMDWGLAFEAKRAQDQEPQTRLPLAVTVEEAAEAGLTLAGEVMGTPGYMPPEQAGGETRIDGRADVFALGGILVAILTGKGPVDGASAINKLTATMRGEIVSPRDRNGRVPADLDGIAVRALAVDREQRTPSAEAFVEELKAFLAGEEVPRHRYGLGERCVRAARRRPALMIAATLGTLLAALAGVGEMQLARADRARAQAEAEQVRVEAERARAEAERARAEATLESKRQAIERTTAIEAALERLVDAERLAARKGAPDRIRALVKGALEQAPYPFVRWQAVRIYRKGGLVEDGIALLEAEVAARTREGKHAIRELFALHELRMEAADDPANYFNDPVLVESFRQALESGVDDEVTFMARGAVAAEAGEHEQAISLYDQALERAPGFWWALMHRGMSKDALGRHQEAIEDFEQASSFEPTAFAPHYLRGQCRYTHLGDAQGALSDLDRAVTIAPDFVYGLYARSQVRLELGHYREAVEDLTRLIARNDTLMEAYVNRAAAYARLGEHEAAIADCDRALILAPGDPEALGCRAGARFARGDDAGTLADCEEILKVDRGRAAAISYYYRGRVYERQGEEERALEAYAAAVKHAPDGLEARLRLALLLRKRGELREAVAEWDRYLAQHQGNAWAWNNRGYAYFWLKEYEKAVADYDRAIELSPQEPAFYVNRAHARRWLEEFEGAMADYRTRLRLKPGSSGSYRGMGRVRIRQGRFAEAVEYLDRAIELSPKYSGAFGNRAEAKLGLGDLDGAAGDCAKCLELDPDMVFVHEVRARIKLKRGDRAGARADLERYLGLDTIEPWRVEAATALLARLKE